MRMTAPEIELFRRTLRGGGRYLEYGAGGSTREAIGEDSIESITSVESDPHYVEEHLLKDPLIAESIRSGRLQFKLVDIGPTKEWGNPTDQSKRYLWPNYALCPHLHGPKPDLVLIDGRFRVACALVCCLEHPEATVMIHDFTTQPQYRVVDRFIEIVDSVDTLVVCKRNRAFDESEARKLLHRYLHEPNDTPHSLVKKGRIKLASWKRQLKGA